MQMEAKDSLSSVRWKFHNKNPSLLLDMGTTTTQISQDGIHFKNTQTIADGFSVVVPVVVDGVTTGNHPSSVTTKEYVDNLVNSRLGGASSQVVVMPNATTAQLNYTESAHCCPHHHHRGPQGFQGVSGGCGKPGCRGFQGPTGRPGCDGDKGKRGFQGGKGPEGPPGEQGRGGPQGKIGYQGNEGCCGPPGKRGYRGHQGYLGFQGQFGEPGQNGEIGPQGNDGHQGRRGECGGRGCRGPQGRGGSQGDLGQQGQDGQIGMQGFDGYQGRIGNDGLNGAQGRAGDGGAQGRDGNDGLNGAQGRDGNDGLNGAQGRAGNDGLNGAQGRAGNDGLNGAQGRAGNDGLNGAQGRAGDGGAQGRVGDGGAQGAQGFEGRQGSPKGIDSINIWSEQQQGHQSSAYFQNVWFEAGVRGPQGGSFGLINGPQGPIGIQNNSGSSAFCLVSYKIDIRSAGGGGGSSSNTTAAATVMLDDVSYPGSTTLVQAPETNHIYTVPNTFLLNFPAGGIIRLMWWANDLNAHIGEPATLVGRFPNTTTSPDETTASMVVTRIA